MRGPVASRRYRAIAIVAATVSTALSVLAASSARALAATQIQVYGTWLCGTDECTWASAPNMTTFDQDNHWLTTSNPVLDYANAMVSNKQLSAKAQEEQWQEHVSGEPRYSPQVPPLAPAKFTGSVYLAETSQITPECDNFSASLESSTGSFVQDVAPSGAGTTPGMLGYMFWAAGQPSAHGTNTFPPDSCQGGVGAGSSTYSIPLPMPALRQS